MSNRERVRQPKILRHAAYRIGTRAQAPPQQTGEDRPLALAARLALDIEDGNLSATISANIDIEHDVCRMPHAVKPLIGGERSVAS